MEIKEALKLAAVEAAKAKDQVRLDTVRMVNSAIRYKEIEKRGPLGDAEVKGVLSTLVKQRRESIEQFKKGGRQDLVDKESREAEILLSFLPQQLGRDQIVMKAKEVIASVGAQSKQDMGKVMKLLVKDLAGQADGATVSQVVSELLK